MPENVAEIGEVNYRRLFPWCHLFRAFGIAIDIRKIFLAGLALMMLSAGSWLFSYLPVSNERASDQQREWPWQTRFNYGPSEADPSSALQVASGFVEHPSKSIVDISTNWSLVLSPIRTLVDPVVLLFRVDKEKTWSEIAYAWSMLLWGLSVWAVFGGAITRMAAVQFARDDSVGIRAALNFSGERFLSYVYAPLLPIAAIGILWFICFVGGLIGRTPAVGELLVGVSFIIPLAFGFLMALLLIGTGVGWPLMFATISTEGSDGFDGLSRSYSYVFDRPWYYLWLVVLTMVYGSVVIFFVWLVTSLLVYLAGWSLAMGVGLETVDGMFQVVPPLLGGENLMVVSDNTTIPDFLGTAAVGWWLQIVATLLVGFVYSYFWTAATIIYFLLRKSDDKTDLEDVYYPIENEQDELLPVLGVQGVDQTPAKAPTVVDEAPTDESETKASTDASSQDHSSEAPKES